MKTDFYDGLAAVLDGKAEPNASMQPTGYTVALNGTVATLTLPNGATCAFDGRTWRRGDGKRAGEYLPTDPDTAQQRAHDAAWSAARTHAGPTTVVRLPVPVEAQEVA